MRSRRKLSIVRAMWPLRVHSDFLAGDARHLRAVWAVNALKQRSSERPFDGNLHTQLAVPTSATTHHMGRTCVPFKARQPSCPVEHVPFVLIKFKDFGLCAARNAPAEWLQRVKRVVLIASADVAYAPNN